MRDKGCDDYGKSDHDDDDDCAAIHASPSSMPCAVVATSGRSVHTLFSVIQSSPPHASISRSLILSSLRQPSPSCLFANTNNGGALGYFGNSAFSDTRFRV